MIILSNLILLPQIVHNIRMGNNPGFNYFYIFGFIGIFMYIIGIYTMIIQVQDYWYQYMNAHALRIDLDWHQI